MAPDRAVDHQPLALPEGTREKMLRPFSRLNPLNRLARLLFAATFLATFLAACAAPAASPPSPTSPAAPTLVPTAASTAIVAPTTSAISATASTSFPLTVTDDAGHKVTFQHVPTRIVSLSPGHTETLYALGLGNQVVAADSYSDYPPEVKSKATLKTYPTPNLEQLVALQPDLVVVLVEGTDFLQQMDARQIPAIKLDPASYDATLTDIELLGRITGTEAKAQQLTATMRQREAAVAAKVKGAPTPTVLCELDASDPTKPYVAGPGEFFGNLVPLAGGKNVFNDIGKGFAQVSAEQVIARNPDIIVLSDTDSPFNAQTPAMVKARTGWSQITAVKNNRVVAIDNALISRPSPRLADGLEAMAKLIHPELFP